MDGRVPSPSPHPSHPTLALCSFRRTPPFANSLRRLRLSLTLVAPHLCLDPKIKSSLKAQAAEPCSQRRALCRRSLSLSKTSIVLQEKENNASGPVVPWPKIALANTLSPSPAVGAPEPHPTPPRGQGGRMGDVLLTPSSARARAHAWLARGRENQKRGVGRREMAA